MRAITTSRLLLLILLLWACESGLPWTAEGGSPADRESLGPAVAYDRHLLFLGTGPDLPTAATFDFHTVSDSSGVHRDVHARIATARRWDPLVDDSWSMAPMREPWRILPRGRLRVIVTDAGELGALVHEGDAPVRVEAGGLIAEDSPDGGAQFVLRSARLTAADSTFTGVLLDAQAGWALDDAGSVASRERIEALLTHGTDYHIVVASSQGSLLAWVHDSDGIRIVRDIRLEPDTAQADTLPGWRIGDTGELIGQVRAEMADPAPPAGGDTELDDYTLVSGWIEDAGVRRDVFGLVRSAR